MKKKKIIKRLCKETNNLYSTLHPNAPQRTPTHPTFKSIVNFVRDVYVPEN